MLKITIAEENQRARTIRIPYSIIGTAGRIATSKPILKLMESRIKKLEDNWKWQLGQIDLKDIQPLLKEMKKYKGLTIVDIQGDNGQIVKIEL